MKKIVKMIKKNGENDKKNGENDEKNGKKYLILDFIEKYEEVFSRIRSEIKTIVEKNFFTKKIMQESVLIQTIIYC